MKIPNLPTAVSPFGAVSEINLQNKGIASADQERAARDFEALMVHQMMQAMWKTVPKEGVLGANNADEFFNDMLHEALAASISQGRGVGISDVLEREFASGDDK